MWGLLLSYLQPVRTMKIAQEDQQSLPQPIHPCIADEAEDTLTAAAASLDAGSRGGKGLQFSDKDEHMYFWFPLLAGLSELTFDPRPDIRYSALEVHASTAEALLRATMSQPHNFLEA